MYRSRQQRHTAAAVVVAMESTGVFRLQALHCWALGVLLLCPGSLQTLVPGYTAAEVSRRVHIYQVLLLL